ncbi:MAG TPA: SRPBCC family protein [Pseudomonadales bacterium]|nr:SRPBCC family protein [Pseudomonadales bacterium]
MQRFVIRQEVKAPLEKVFDAVTDHEFFIRNAMLAPCKRIKDGANGYVNGLGSVREITVPLPQLALVTLHEEVTSFEPNKLMQYVIVKGAPLSHYLGTIEFTGNDRHTNITYRVEMDADVPGLAFVVSKAMYLLFFTGLRRIAKILEK